MERNQLLVIGVFVVLAFIVGYFFGSETIGFVIFDYDFEGDLDVIFSNNSNFEGNYSELFLNDTVYFSVLTKIPQNKTYSVRISGPNYEKAMSSTASNKTFQIFWFEPEEKGLWKISVDYENRTFSKTLVVSKKSITQSTISKTQDITANDFAWFSETIEVMNDFSGQDYDLGIQGFNVSVYDYEHNLVSNSSKVFAGKGITTFFVEYSKEPPTTLEVVNATGKYILVSNPENYSKFRIRTEMSCNEPRLFSEKELTNEINYRFNYGNSSLEWVCFGEKWFLLTCKNWTFQKPQKEAIMFQPIVGKPVKWIKNVSGDNPVFNISREALNLTISKIVNNSRVMVLTEKVKQVGFEKTIEDSGDFEIEYFTEAPQKIEKKISQFKKQVTIFAPDRLNYSDVVSFANITEITSRERDIHLYWLVDGKRKEHSFTSNDTNGKWAD